MVKTAWKIPLVSLYTQIETNRLKTPRKRSQTFTMLPSVIRSSPIYSETSCAWMPNLRAVRSRALPFPRDATVSQLQSSKLMKAIGTGFADVDVVRYFVRFSFCSARAVRRRKTAKGDISDFHLHIASVARSNASAQMDVGVNSITSQNTHIRKRRGLPLWKAQTTTQQKSVDHSSKGEARRSLCHRTRRAEGLSHRPRCWLLWHRCKICPTPLSTIMADLCCRSWDLRYSATHLWGQIDTIAYDWCQMSFLTRAQTGRNTVASWTLWNFKQPSFNEYRCATSVLTVSILLQHT